MGEITTSTLERVCSDAVLRDHIKALREREGECRRAAERLEAELRRRANVQGALFCEAAARG